VVRRRWFCRSALTGLLPSVEGVAEMRQRRHRVSSRPKSWRQHRLAEVCNRKHGPYLIRRLSQVVGVSRSFSETRFPLPQTPQERSIEDSSAGLHTDNQTRSTYDIILRDSEAMRIASAASAFPKHYYSQMAVTSPSPQSSTWTSRPGGGPMTSGSRSHKNWGSRRSASHCTMPV
jgi:hypothetical protein